jgi:hypothetical protein
LQGIFLGLSAPIDEGGAQKATVSRTTATHFMLTR